MYTLYNSIHVCCRSLSTVCFDVKNVCPGKQTNVLNETNQALDASQMEQVGSQLVYTLQSLMQILYQFDADILYVVSVHIFMLFLYIFLFSSRHWLLQPKNLEAFVRSESKMIGLQADFFQQLIMAWLWMYNLYLCKPVNVNQVVSSLLWS